jgi:uroporphyrinogen decarboxylase
VEFIMIFLDACRLVPTSRPPVWLLRQTGPHLAPFRELREEYGFFEIRSNPKLIEHLTLLPVQTYSLDAAVLFVDIAQILKGAGFLFSFDPLQGPIIKNPLRFQKHFAMPCWPDLAMDLSYLTRAIKSTRAHLADTVALIGVTGGPLTLACHALMGAVTQKAQNEFRQWLFRSRAQFTGLLDAMVDLVVEHCLIQAEAGVNAIQVFDPVCAAFSAYDFQSRLMPRLQQLAERTAGGGIPRILYIPRAAHLRWFLGELGFEVIGLDWTMPIAHTRRLLGGNVAIQGNLDPAILLGEVEFIVERTLAMLQANARQAGFIANVGSGLFSATTTEQITAFVQTVKSFSSP